MLRHEFVQENEMIYIKGTKEVNTHLIFSKIDI